MTTIVSRRDGEDGAARLIVDAGSKVLASDRASWASGYGRVVEHPDARIVALSEHHATIVVPHGAASGLALGKRLIVVPNHVCTAVNLVDELVAIGRHGDEELWPVAARGANT